MATAKKTAAKRAAPAGKTAAKKAPAKKAAAKKAVAAKAAAGSADAIALLTADHAEVDRLFERYERLAEADAAADERETLARQICSLLTVHAAIEEEIFYPAAREACDEDDLLDEAEVEHASAKDLIAQIEEMDADDDLYDAKVKVLGEYVRHHVQEEETEMFPQCRSAKMDLQALGARLAARKQELKSGLAGADA